MPVVLTRLEIEKLFEHISGTNLLAAELIYGCGLRLRECVKIRIKDIDFERRRLVVMGGKGDTDRQTLLPECLWKKLHGQIERSRLLLKLVHYIKPGRLAFLAAITMGSRKNRLTESLKIG